MKAVGALFLALCVCVAAPVQAGTQSQILRDTTEDWHPELWFATLLEPDFESVPALSFVGNGQLLSRVGGVFIVDESWLVPFEDLTEFNDFPLWIGFFDSYNDVQSNPMAGQQVAGPVNAGWQHPIAVTEYDEDVFYLEWDVLPLGLTTTAGQEHFVTLTPLNPDPDKYPLLTPYLLGSTVPDGPIDYGFMGAGEHWHWWEERLETFYGEGNRSAAVRIEAVPEPGCLTAIASGALIGLFAMLRRRRRT